MNYDYSNVSSSDYGDINSTGLEVPTAWKLQNRKGYDRKMQGNRQLNFLANTNSSPKSYATLTGGKQMPSQSYASSASVSKVKFETTGSPDYMGFSSAYTPDRSSNLNYYMHSPSTNLSMVSRSAGQMNQNGLKKASYEPIDAGCVALNDPVKYDQCVKADCTNDCVLKCVDEGDCQCMSYDENGMCVQVDKPEIPMACADKCFSDYSTQYQPLYMAKSKMRMAKMKK